MAEKEFCPKCHETHDPDIDCGGLDLKDRADRLMAHAEKMMRDGPPKGDFIPPAVHIYGGDCHPFIQAVERVWFKMLDLGRPDSVKDAIEYTKEIWTLSQPFIKEITDADMKRMEECRQEYMKKIAEGRKPA